MAGNGYDIINTIIALTDMIGSVAKGIKKLSSIWRRKAAKIKKTIPPTAI